MRRAERLWVPFCFLVLVYCCWRPIGNFDLFFHLAVGKEFLASGRVPRADFLSYTRAGTPWIDHEWLAQVLYLWIARGMGLAALIVLKTLLFVGAAACIERLLFREGTPASFRGAAVLMFACATLLQDDVRPENFTVFLFAAELWFLERLRRSDGGPGSGAILAGFGGFMLWANLHAGFILGLALEACYAAEALVRRDRPGLRRYGWISAASAAGTLANPFGWGVYAFLLEHGRHSVDLRDFNSEWHPMFISDPYNWPFWLLLVLLIAAALIPRARRRLSSGEWLAAAGLAAATIWHRRVVPFSVAAALAYGPKALREIPASFLRRAAPAASAVLLCAAILFLGAYHPWRAPFTALQEEKFPMKSADFLEAEAAALGPLTLYHPLAWGGYLGYRLYPRYRVFTHSMFLMFLDIVLDELKSMERPSLWESFLDRRHVELALMRRNLPDMTQKRVLPGGAVESESRPYYLFFMPQDRWNLVFWDQASMVFVRAGTVSAEWARRHAYRWMHPGDSQALLRAWRGGRIPPKGFFDELCRHRRESGPDSETEYFFNAAGLETCPVTPASAP